TPACQIDLRVGGKYVYCMRSPEGQDTWAAGVYREVTPVERLVFTDSFADEHGNVVPGSRYSMPDMPLEMLVTVDLEDLAGKTRLASTHAGLLPGEMAEVDSAGWNESFDKLAAMLA